MGQLTQDRFADIVNKVASEMSRDVASFSVGGFWCDVMFWSRSRKQTWQAVIEFDAQTGDLTAHASYPDATALHRFGTEVQRRVRDIIAS
jgi:hypothetical protein